MSECGKTTTLVLLPKQQQQQIELTRLKAEVSDLKVGAVSLLHKAIFIEQSFPCSWDSRTAKLCVYPREETACQHEFRTNPE